MPEPPEIARLSAEVSAGSGEKYSPEGLRLEADINGFPSVKCNIVGKQTDGSPGILAPASAAVLERIGTLQQERLAGRSSPDLSLFATDGAEGAVQFEGYMSAPTLEISKTSTTDQFSAVGYAALLDALDLSIYDSSYITKRQADLTETDDGGELKPLPAAESGNVTELLLEMTDILVENFEAVLEAESRPVSKELLALQHQVNGDGDDINSPLGIWRSILSNSEVVFDSWEEALAKSNQIGVQLTNKLKAVIMDKTPGFWNKVRSLMAGFQMYYVPEFGGAGRFVRADKKIDGEDGENIDLQVSVQSFTVVDGSPRILQPGGVVMMGTAAAAERSETDTSGQDGPAMIRRAIAYAPDPLIAGFIQHENPPFWLVDKDAVPVLGSEIDEVPEAQGPPAPVDLNIKGREKRVKEGFKFKDEIDTVSVGVMTELCEIMFKEMQLAHSTAVISIPLEFDMNNNIGKRANITIKSLDGEDEGSFEAFISGVTHIVDLRQGKQLESNTQVRLTHAKYFE